MNEHHDKTEQEAGDGQDIKRWTAKRRAALVFESLRGQTTVAETARTHGLKASDISLSDAQLPLSDAASRRSTTTQCGLTHGVDVLKSKGK